jgi:hypothetical protein
MLWVFFFSPNKEAFVSIDSFGFYYQVGKIHPKIIIIIIIYNIYIDVQKIIFSLKFSQLFDDSN